MQRLPQDPQRDNQIIVYVWRSREAGNGVEAHDGHSSLEVHSGGEVTYLSLYNRNGDVALSLSLAEDVAKYGREYTVYSLNHPANKAREAL